MLTPFGSADLGVAAALRLEARAGPVGQRGRPQQRRQPKAGLGRACAALPPCGARSPPALLPRAPCTAAGPGPGAAPAMVRCGVAVLRKVSAAGPGSGGDGGAGGARVAGRAGGSRGATGGASRAVPVCPQRPAPSGPAGHVPHTPVCGARPGPLRSAGRGPARREVSLPGKTYQTLVKNDTLCFLKFRLLP